MKIKASLLLLLFLFPPLVYAADYGIYEKVIENAAATPEEVAAQIATAIESSPLTLLDKLHLATPNLVQQDETKHTDFKAFLVLATCPSFDSTVVSFSTRYAADWILRVGIYEDEHGTQVQIANLETLTRIICNDLPDDDYRTVVTAAKKLMTNVRQIIASAAVAGKEVSIQMPPIRSEKRLRKAKKDMPMMVGPLTYFKSSKQFPILWEQPVGEDASETFNRVLAEVEKNISQFQPSEKDTRYHWCNNPGLNLKWQIACTVKLAGINAAVIGITRGRTEALSFHICGMKRESDTNPTPGIDHVAAYPIEVVVFEETGKIKVGTAREMFRMDMFFWDAGKMAFMKYMNMPKTLDKSIKNAVVGTKAK